jgi:large subunit ribosomal protein L5
MREKYQNEAAPALLKEFGYSSPMAIPKVAYVKLNMGLGEAIANSRVLDVATDEMAAIAGQKPIITKARKSISNFKLREGASIGCCVTLRGARMYEFLDRLVTVALPRVRDFRGISPKSFDGRGNYTLGVREHVIFPEIDYTKVEQIKGMNVTIVTTATTDPEGLSLLKNLGMPFRS